MNACLLVACLPCTSSRALQSFHYNMFHGEAEVNGKRPALAGRRHPGLEVPPLQLVRNVYEIPPIFVARGNFIVSEELAETFQVMTGLELQEVVFKRVFELPYELGMEMPEKLERLRPDQWFAGAIRLGRPASQPQSRFFECRMWSPWDVAGPDAPQVRWHDPCSGRSELFVDGRTLLQKYDACTLGGTAFLFRRAALESFQKCLRAPYFAYQAID